MNKIPKLTPEQGAIISAYTGILACSFSTFHEYAEQLLGRPIFSHEFASKRVADELKEKSRDDFLSIVEKAGDRGVPN